MKRSFFDSKTIVLYALFITLALIAPLFGNRIVTTFSENQQEHHYVVLDAGHGGVDGGAVFPHRSDPGAGQKVSVSVGAHQETTAPKWNRSEILIFSYCNFLLLFFLIFYAFN